jgi:mannose-1-phosphate guanylyltransferase
MKAVLLGAGRGTRLAPLTDTVPKILAPLAGRPLLEHQLAYLAGNGVSEVFLNVHHHADRVLEFVGRVETPVRVRVSYEPVLLGTAGALVPLRDELRETFALLYGDVITDEPLAAVVAAHRRTGGIATIACYRADDPRGKGVITVDPNGRVMAFAEKPQEVATRAMVNAGLYVLEPEVFELVEPGSSFGVDIWPRALAEGRRVNSYRVTGYVRDVGTPATLSSAARDLSAGALSWSGVAGKSAAG